MNEKKMYTVEEFVEAYGQLYEMSHSIAGISKVDFKLNYSGLTETVQELDVRLRLKNAEVDMAEFMKREA